MNGVCYECICRKCGDKLEEGDLHDGICSEYEYEESEELHKGDIEWIF